MPAWTAVTQYVLFKEKLSWKVYITLVPIIGGAMMVCKGEVGILGSVNSRSTVHPLELLSCS